MKRLRYRPGVTAELPPDESPTMTVYRPTRKCPKCGLVNVTGARRCRRCERSLDAFDRGAASERLVNRLQSRRRLIFVIVGLSLAAVVAMGIGIKWRFDSIERFRDESRAVDTDVKTLLRGARADAEILVGAFDDREFTVLLKNQGPTWSERVRACTKLRDRARELSPLGADQTRIAIEIGGRLEEARVASGQLAHAAESSDVIVGRAAAAKLIENDPEVSSEERR